MNELIDVNDNSKMMAMVLCGIFYDGHEYLLYSIKRSASEANLFISKLVKNSSGYTISHDFDNGEKDVFESVVQRIISKEAIGSLEKDGFRLLPNIKLGNINYFDMKKCYIATVSVHLVRECLIYYEFLNDDFFKRPVVEVKNSKKFNQGFVGNIIIICFGIFIIMFCIGVVFSIFFN